MFTKGSTGGQGGDLWSKGGMVDLKHGWTKATPASEPITLRWTTTQTFCQLLDCGNFCRTFELALRGHDEREELVNPGIFRGLWLCLTLDNEGEFQGYFENNPK